MKMMANEGNEGNNCIEDIDVLNTCHILLPYPDASAYALAPETSMVLGRIFVDVKMYDVHFAFCCMKVQVIYRSL